MVEIVGVAEIIWELKWEIYNSDEGKLSAHGLWVGGQVRVRLEGSPPTAFDGPHLLGVVVIIRECPVDVGHAEVVSLRDRPGIEAPILDLGLEETDGEAPALQMWFVVNLADDAARDLAHGSR